MVNQLVIKNALVFDGTGAPGVVRDVSVSGGKIVASNALGHIDHTQTIDATGLALMPGIIDSHTHYDAQITWDNSLKPSPSLGVTTAVIGNCGFTIAPCKPEHRDLTMRNLTQVEGMSLEVLRSGIDWGFESFAQYMKQLQSKGCIINTAAYIGHSSVRTYVMGEDAAKRTATPKEIEAMAELVRAAMRAGAIGFASSTSPAHNGEGGLPMPSRLACDAEMLALTKAMGEPILKNGSSVKTGVYMVTKGGHMSIEFLEQLSQESGRPVMIAEIGRASCRERV